MSNNSNPNDYVDQFGTRQQTNSRGALGGITQGLFGGPGINGAAPTIDASGMTSAITQAQQGRGLQGQAAGLAGQLARGQGPSAVSQAYNQQVNNSTAAANALASSAPGADQAMARRQAMMTAAQGQQAAGGSAALGHAQEQLGGVGTMGSLAGQQRGQDLATGNLLGGLASNQAQLQEQQNQANLQAAETQEKQNASSLMSMAGMAAGALAFADAPMGSNSGGGGPQGSEMHLKEPNGPSHFILREEPDFILIVNARTGKMGKLPMMPLSPEEQKQAMAPHGAGPIGQSVNAIRAGDAQLSNLNDDPNQSGDSGGVGAFMGGAMQMAGGAMGAGDFRFGKTKEIPHGTSPHVMAPHAASLPQAVKTKHGGLYYGDLDMGSPDMSRLDFDKLGPGGTSKETSMPVQKMDDRNFGKYSTPGKGVGGGDATDPNAATGADPYAANPGENNPATNPDSQDPSFGKVLAGALKGYADPQSALAPQGQQMPGQAQAGAGTPPATAIGSSLVANPRVASPLVMHDGTTSGADPSGGQGAQMLQQLDQQRMGLGGLGGYDPANMKNTVDPQRAQSSQREQFVQNYNNAQNDNQRRDYLSAMGDTQYAAPKEGQVYSPPNHLSLMAEYDPQSSQFEQKYYPTVTTDEQRAERDNSGATVKGATPRSALPPENPYAGLPPGLKLDIHSMGQRDTTSVTQDTNGNDKLVPRLQRAANGQLYDTRIAPMDVSASVQKAKPLTQKFASRSKPRGKKQVLQDASNRGKSA